MSIEGSLTFDDEYVVCTLSLEAVLARGMIEECDVISVVSELMAGSRFGSRYG
jgi:hypothetical protein